MYLLTRQENDLESGAYASVDDDGTPIVQFFVNEDDAVTYSILLEAIDQKISITEIDDEILEKFTGAMGHAYSVADEGEIVIPKIETLQHVIFES